MIGFFIKEEQKMMVFINISEGKIKNVRIRKETKKPTGKNIESEEYTIRLSKEYVGQWLPIKDEMHYLLIEV